MPCLQGSDGVVGTKLLEILLVVPKVGHLGAFTGGEEHLAGRCPLRTNLRLQLATCRLGTVAGLASKAASGSSAAVRILLGLAIMENVGFDGVTNCVSIFRRCYSRGLVVELCSEGCYRRGRRNPGFPMARHEQLAVVAHTSLQFLEDFPEPDGVFGTGDTLFKPCSVDDSASRAAS